MAKRDVPSFMNGKGILDLVNYVLAMSANTKEAVQLIE